VDIVKYLLQFAMLGSAWVMYLLLGLSVFSIGTMIERFFYFRKRGSDGAELGDELCALLEAGEKEKAKKLLEASPTVEAEVLRASLRWAVGGPETLHAAIEGEMTKRRRDLERGMNLLGTLGNNSPFIGLLGTVIGVIVAFADLGEGSGKVAINKVMSGIAEALVATGVGLFVAIPAVVAFNIFQKKIGDIEDNVSSISRRLCAFVSLGKPEEEVVVSPAAKTGVLKAAESVRNLAEIAGDDEDGHGATDAPAKVPADGAAASVNPAPELVKD
jgi:biopolymer transport protein ExbB/biopolymer transport protein TolQ